MAPKTLELLTEDLSSQKGKEVKLFTPDYQNERLELRKMEFGKDVGYDSLACQCRNCNTCYCHR